WERSAHLKQAQRIVDKAPSSPRARAAVSLVQGEANSIKQLRTQYWNGVHPRNRWTGRSLEQDAAAADAHDNRDFAGYYQERYAETCWSVHGTGLAGVRKLDEHVFPALAAFGFAESA